MPLDGYLKIDGIDGESKDARHTRWIDVNAVSWDAAAPPVMRVFQQEILQAGTPEVSSVQFRQVLNRASPAMFIACATGRAIPEIRFEAQISGHNGPMSVLKVLLKRCLITSISVASQEETISEDYTIAYSSIFVEVEERNP